MDAGPIADVSEQPRAMVGERHVRFRASWQQWLPIVLIFGVGFLNPILWSSSPASDELAVWVWGWPYPAFLVLEGWFLGRWIGVTLTPQAAVVHNLRRRTIPWSRIDAVEVESFSIGGRRVVLYETDGRRTPLRMPSTAFLSWDRKFDEKAAAIRACWLAHGGTAEAVPPCAPEPLPDRVRLRPTAVQAWPLMLFCALPAMDVLTGEFASGSGAGQPTIAGRLLSVLAVVALLLAAAQRAVRGGVTLTSGQLHVHGWRRRALAWSEVQAITVEARCGGRQVVVTDCRGERTRLAAPRVGLLLWDRGFRYRVGLLLGFWRAHRGADWMPVAAAADASRRTNAPYDGPRLWQQIVVSLLCAWIGWMIFLSVLVGTLLSLG